MILKKEEIMILSDCSSLWECSECGHINEDVDDIRDCDFIDCDKCKEEFELID